MIFQSIMIFALGLLIAGLICIAFAPLIWARASNVTRQELISTLPLDEFEIKASRDHLRAEHAIRAHRLESRLEQAEQNNARQLIEMNKREIQINALNNLIVELRQETAEKNSQNIVLMQNIDRKIPQLEDRSNRLMSVLIEREQEIASLKRYGIYGMAQEDDGDEVKGYYKTSEQIEKMRYELGEEIETDGPQRRTIVENAQSIHEENLELFGTVAKLQARLNELESREADETALLRSEMQNIAMALMEEHDEIYRSHFHNLSSFSKPHETTQNQLPFEFEFDGKKPVFIEKAEQAAAERNQNPTTGEANGSLVKETSLTARLETLLKQK